MEEVLEQYEHLEIQLDEIKTATNTFDDQYLIGVGGYGKVYEGEVSHYEGRSKVAIKRLDREHGQGESEFLKEVDRLSKYKHENIISLLGFCYQKDEDMDEAILVYEFASRKSLDRHLNSPDLTWSTRIKICLDAAKGLSYLHDPRGTHQRLIHCDVKGGNILLDDQWNAKIADFGFSIMGSANEQRSTVINIAGGTPGYIDPQFVNTHTLTKESDVYSFGVVLFEVLCGRVCYTVDSKNVVKEVLVPRWKKYYEQDNLKDIIYSNEHIQPLEQSALEIFSDITYRCLEESRDDRPDMADIVIELENALENQKLFESLKLSENQEFIGEWNKQHSYYQNITRPYRSEVDFMKLLSKGILLNQGKTFFSLNKNGKHCEMISIADCLDSTTRKHVQRKPGFDSRFVLGTYCSENGKFKTRVKTQYLSPGITYIVNLVFKFSTRTTVGNGYPITLKYKLQGETKWSISHLAYQREDGWWTTEMYHFVSDDRVFDLRVLFDGINRFTVIEVEGIEFRPLEKVDHKDEHQPTLDSCANWEEKLPTDYDDLMKRSNYRLQWTTKEEAYSIIRKGFLINDGYKGSIWFYVDKNGKKCHMLSAAQLQLSDMYMLSVRESRFEKAYLHDSQAMYIRSEIQSQLVSSKTMYATYLVYKLKKDYSGYDVPVKFEITGSDHVWYVYLVSPQTPIIRPKADQNTHNPLNKLEIISGLPQQRNDGWMEVQIWKFRSTMTTEKIDIRMGSSGDTMLGGLIVEGIEFRPI